jgi:hypothetical protein
VVSFGEHVNNIPIFDQLSEYQFPKKEKILTHEASVLDHVFSITEIVEMKMAID